MFKPYNTYLLIETTKEEEQVTSSGIIVQTKQPKHAAKGKVLAVNVDCEGKIKVGSTVYFNRHALVDLPNETTQKLVRTEDVYGFEE